MTDRWRIIDPSPERGYTGLTELTRDTRSIASVGTGEAVRAAIVARMEWHDE